MQIFSFENNLHKMSEPIIRENKKNITKCDKGPGDMQRPLSHWRDM